MRKSGILLPISSLPSKYGIGTFSKEAYEFVDKLKEANQSIWQILPLGPTGYGDSPYQSFSTFAGNPYFIDLEALVNENLLTIEECESCDWGSDEEHVDYGKVYSSRANILRKAYERSNIKEDENYIKFCNENVWWLNDYTLYMSIKDYLDGKSWTEWDKDLKSRKEHAINLCEEKLKEQIDFYKYVQYLFFTQWSRLKSYANEKGISIIGDVPIYVSLDSADIWSNQKLFQLDKDCNPTAVAGCPPDIFSEDGQLWGNPLYNWEANKEEGYSWWIKRIEYAAKLYDIVRIDHFRGFDEYYSIPADHENAKNGTWKKGPGIELFKTLKEKLGDVNIIAEDLGTQTDSLKELLKDTNYPGMKILQFGFDTDGNNEFLPHNYNRNCVVYTGTHDNSTIQGWYKEIDEHTRKMVESYINDNREEKIHWDLICVAMSSVAELCIIPVQDYLGLDDSATINKPSTLGTNWTWRMKKDSLDESIIEKIKTLTKICARG